MSLAIPPRFEDVDRNGPDFRRALLQAGTILAGRRLNVYCRHRHDEVPIEAGEIIFEEQISPDMLELYLRDEDEAAVFGKPSCWAFTPSKDGEGVDIVVLRYADDKLHDGSDIDVMSTEFLAELDEIAEAFVAAGIHETLELNIAGRLFAAPPGYLTREDTVGVRRQTLTFDIAPDEVLDGDLRSAACWGFSAVGKSLVTGICVTRFGGKRHWEKDDEEEGT